MALYTILDVVCIISFIHLYFFNIQFIETLGEKLTRNNFNNIKLYDTVDKWYVKKVLVGSSCLCGGCGIGVGADIVRDWFM